MRRPAGQAPRRLRTSLCPASARALPWPPSPRRGDPGSPASRAACAPCRRARPPAPPRPRRCSIRPSDEQLESFSRSALFISSTFQDVEERRQQLEERRLRRAERRRELAKVVDLALQVVGGDGDGEGGGGEHVVLSISVRQAEGEQARPGQGPEQGQGPGQGPGLGLQAGPGEGREGADAGLLEAGEQQQGPPAERERDEGAAVEMVREEMPQLVRAAA